MLKKAWENAKMSYEESYNEASDGTYGLPSVSGGQQLLPDKKHIEKNILAAKLKS